MKIMYLYRWLDRMMKKIDVRASSGVIMKINKDRIAVYTKVYADQVATVIEDIFNAEDYVDFKLGVGKAMAMVKAEA